MLSSVYAPKEFKKLRVIGDLVARCFDFIEPHIVAGISTGRIDDLAVRFLQEHGAKSSTLGYMGYPKSICTSVNDVIVHGIPREDEILKNGDIVNVDLTANLKGFHGDASRMYTIGDAAPRTRELVQTTHDAMMAAIAACGPGVPLSEIGKTIEAIAKKHHFGVSQEFVGHGIGKVMHDDPQIYHFYDKRWDSVKMVPGLVFTIEPMLTTGDARSKIDDDGWTARTIDGGMAAQWEHTVGITEDGCVIFTERRFD